MKKIIALLLVALVSMFFMGCEGDTSTKATSTDNIIENQSSVAFVGKVVDVNGDPMPGVSVQLLADVSYGAKTDVNGNWVINVDLGRIAAVGGGGAGEGYNDGGNDDDLGTDPDQIERNFPIEYTMAGYGVYRQEAGVHLTVGYTDGTGAVVLLSKTGTVQPTVVLHPYIDNFCFNVYAGDEPAVGASVLFARAQNDGTDPDEDDTAGAAANAGSAYGNRYEKDAKWFVSGENGEICITAADQLPADGYYDAFGAPFDSDGDGDYEYDATTETIPNSGYELDVQWEHDAMIHYEVDATTGAPVITQTENAPYLVYRDADDDLQVVYCSIHNVELIPIAEAADFTITVMFNRPLIEQNLADVTDRLFELTAKGGAIVVPITWTNTGNWMYTITPAQTLTNAWNEYEFKINDGITGYPGGGSLAEWTQEFNIYDPNATLIATTITPGLDLNEYKTFMVDWDYLWVGDQTVVKPLAPGNAPDQIPNLQISYELDPEAAGYQVWIRSLTTLWQQVTSLETIYNDGLFAEVNIDLTDGLSGAAAWEDLWDAAPFAKPPGFNSVEPFFAGQQLWVTVVKENSNGFAIDPNNIAEDDTTFVPMKLKDNFGARIVDTGWNLTATTFTDDTRYDALAVPVCADEPLADATYTAEYTTGLGARAQQGYFTVTDVYWGDNDLDDPANELKPSNRECIYVDLKSNIASTLSAAAETDDETIAVADQTGFAIGDNLVVGDNGAFLDSTKTQAFDLEGFNATTFYLSQGLKKDAASGAAVYARGDMDAGYAAISGDLPDDTDALDGTVVVVDNDDSAALVLNRSVITSPAKLAARVSSVDGLSDAFRLGLDDDPTGVTAAGTVLSGYTRPAANDDVTAVAALDGDDEIVVASGGFDWEEDDLIALNVGGDDEQLLQIEDIREDQPIAGQNTLELSDDLTADLALGASLYQIEDNDQFAYAMAYGWPAIEIEDVTGIKPGTSITFEDDDETATATIVEAYLTTGLGANNVIVIDEILQDAEDVDYTFAGGSDYTTDASRLSDILQVDMLDRSGNYTATSTDIDGDGESNYDQIGYADEDSAFGVF